MLQGQPFHPLKYALQILTDASRRASAHLGEPGLFQKQVTHKVSGTKVVFWLCLNLIATIATDNTMVVAYLGGGGGGGVSWALFVPYYGESGPGGPGKRLKPDTFTLQPCLVQGYTVSRHNV